MHSGTDKRLALKLAESHEKLKSWRKVAQKHKILTKDGKLNPSLAQRLANGYEPRTIELRNRLGLPPLCPECHRRIPHLHNGKTWVSIDKLTSSQVLYLLKTREPFPKATKAEIQEYREKGFTWL